MDRDVLRVERFVMKEEWRSEYGSNESGRGFKNACRGCGDDECELGKEQCAISEGGKHSRKVE